MLCWSIIFNSGHYLNWNYLHNHRNMFNLGTFINTNINLLAIVIVLHKLYNIN